MNISRRQLLRGQASLDDLSRSVLKAELGQTPAQQELEISDSCLAFNYVACRSCQDICESRAISFQLQIGKPALPSIDNELCSSCGECLDVCPSKAISVVSKSLKVTENDKNTVRGEDI